VRPEAVQEKDYCVKALITGIAGFAGSHLAELLLKDGEEIYGTVLPNEGLHNLDSLHAHLKLVPCDLRNAEAIERVVARVKPDFIYHLAALTFIPDSVLDPRETFDDRHACIRETPRANRKLRLRRAQDFDRRRTRPGSRLLLPQLPEGNRKRVQLFGILSGDGGLDRGRVQTGDKGWPRQGETVSVRPAAHAFSPAGKPAGVVGISGCFADPTFAVAEDHLLVATPSSVAVTRPGIATQDTQ
jgi:hypothetical protein